MVETMWVTDEKCEHMQWFRIATPAEIDAAANVTELRERLAAAEARVTEFVILGKKISALFAKPEDHYFGDYVIISARLDELLAALSDTKTEAAE
jgi:hypothetical protein